MFPLMEPISQRRAEEITGIAHTYWLGFNEALGKKGNEDWLFQLPERGRVNQCVLLFFRYCAQIRLGVAGATVAPTESIGHGVPSWLWHQGGGVPWVLLDFKEILSKFSIGEERKIVTRIILHEIGHLVLHFQALAGMGKGLVPSSNAIQEEEAWLFCSVIMGLALGNLAKSKRPNSVDAAWSHSC